MLRGVEKLADAVAITMGPTGRNVIIDKSFGGPTVTKDGVTVSKEVELEDRFENMGAKLVNEVASKTSDVAGDGTTTATVFAQALVRGGMKIVTSGANPMAVKRGIDKAVDAVVEHLDLRDVDGAPKGGQHLELAHLIAPRLAGPAFQVGVDDRAAVGSRANAAQRALNDDANFPWLILVPRLADLRDLHDLPAARHGALMAEIDRASRALAAVTGDEHFIKQEYFDDGRILDPDHPESLVYEPQPLGLASASGILTPRSPSRTS